MKFVRGLLSAFVTIGAINWGLMGVRRFDAVERLFGYDTKASKIVYSLVGLAGIYHIFKIKREAIA